MHSNENVTKWRVSKFIYKKKSQLNQNSYKSNMIE